MTGVLVVEQSPLIVQLRLVVEMTDEQFFEFCQFNCDRHIGRTATGDLIIVPPTGSESRNRNAKITQQPKIELALSLTPAQVLRCQMGQSDRQMQPGFCWSAGIH
jgi:Uma2 family endonuclease